MSSSGKLSAKAKGKVTITVISGNQKIPCRVTVEDPKLNHTTLVMNLKEVGETVVKAKVHGKTYSCKVTVKEPDIESIAVGKYEAVITGS